MNLDYSIIYPTPDPREWRMLASPEDPAPRWWWAVYTGEVAGQVSSALTGVLGAVSLMAFISGRTALGIASFIPVVIVVVGAIVVEFLLRHRELVLWPSDLPERYRGAIAAADIEVQSIMRDVKSLPRDSAIRERLAAQEADLRMVVWKLAKAAKASTALFPVARMAEDGGRTELLERVTGRLETLDAQVLSHLDRLKVLRAQVLGLRAAAAALDPAVIAVLTDDPTLEPLAGADLYVTDVEMAVTALTRSLAELDVWAAGPLPE